ncbi:aminoglycoside phosphotransferase family protein [Microbacterium sp.]|uniref:aminoglycoside phosphotransferase family protein n=1 Tax=Microbacterium sp. TaxID=51671 RepID=UPI002E35026C|nr:aminoglycoside phosphotransferase family protein [Microbacterium sp.]HEX5729850.1 aminoglycoside phosphotransferase family protein [Microbacterium sp.]
MPDKPAAEVQVHEQLVRALISSQATAIPDAATLPLAHAADGWDCSVWRLGDDFAVRLPRRALSAPLVLHEQAVLPSIAARLAPSGVGVPAPIVSGRPELGYPWPWSVVPWFDGTAGLGIPRADRAGWATPLAEALLALHVPAPPDHPVNSVRGVPLARRADAVAGRMESLRGRVSDVVLERAGGLWAAGLHAPPWSGGPRWIHGDLHPGNLIARGSHLVAIIDFGDVTGGDPAYDLAVAWLAFDQAGRSSFRAAAGDGYDEATWTRAHAWAAAFTLLLLDRTDDDPEYATLAADALQELSG